jgi:hypothetical protein
MNGGNSRLPPIWGNSLVFQGLLQGRCHHPVTIVSYSDLVRFILKKGAL